MKVVVVGAGAVGGYFGERLQEAGLDVTFLVRANRAEQLHKNGLVIQSPAGNVQLTPQIALDAGHIGACDLVLLAVKNYHLKPMLASISPLVERGAKILPLLNGVEHFEILEHAFGKKSFLGGLCQKKIGLILIIISLALFVIGFFYEGIFAGIPYQDPTPELMQKYMFYNQPRSNFRQNWVGDTIFESIYIIGTKAICDV